MFDGGSQKGHNLLNMIGSPPQHTPYQPQTVAGSVVSPFTGYFYGPTLGSRKFANVHWDFRSVWQRRHEWAYAVEEDDRKS